ncbi:zinc finger protein ENHYDROUS-like [Zingiber officinale]|uniref:zinc finger protein ENHYDROUS-like n=1 Tax=Zingiber officinale TaxID=94328 RepID=UPI001C4C7697|nr:zinc finger protein ENHYDROUS-like [Zingiber officinale]
MMEYENSSVMTVSNSGSGEASVSSSGQLPPAAPPSLGPLQPIPVVKKKRNLPGTPDPEAEVIALSPKTLMATNRFVCEICNKGFQRDQNLQLHRRGHNLPWKLRQRTGKEVRKRVYVCPEPTCVHHDPSRALGDLTGIKKHFCRKHGEKKWKCDKCSKKYAVQSDWKAHSKVCGTREYRCDCGTLFSRRDSFITHRAFCDALAEESAKAGTTPPTANLKPASEDDGKAEAASEKATEAEEATATVETAPAVAVDAPLPLPKVAPPLERQEPEKSAGLLPYVRQSPVALANTSSAAVAASTTTSSSSNSNNISMFASIFASVSATTAAHSSTTFSDLMGAMGHPDRSLAEPLSLCLAPNGGPPSSLFSPPQNQSHDWRPFSAPPPPPSPHMSATALLQKAAQMGAAATGSSFLKGFGLDGPGDSSLRWGHHRQQQQHLEPEPSPMLPSGLGLGLPYEQDLMMGSSALFGTKPATLDFLGLGMGPVGGTPNGGLSALMTSIGSSSLDIGTGPATTGGWEGTERKSTSSANL